MSFSSLNAVYDLHHQVDSEEIDWQGHVHNLRYIAWTLRAAGRHSEALGWNADQMHRELGCGWVVRSHEATYRLAALRGEHLVVRTWIESLSKHSATRRYLVCRPVDQKVLARISTRWVMVDLNIRKAVAIPQPMLAKIAVLTSPPPPPWEEASLQANESKK